MSWQGEREQTKDGRYANRKLPLPPGAETAHAHAVRVQMPGVGLFIVNQGTLDMIRGKEWLQGGGGLTLLDLKYRSWNVVRKGAVSRDGVGLYGFRGYFEGLGWTNEEVNTYLLNVGQGILDSITRLHPYNYTLKRSCIGALSGEKPFTAESYEQLSASFGATLGRLRTLVYHEENIHSGPTHGDPVIQARQINEAFHQSAVGMATQLPQSRIDFNPGTPEEFNMLYYLPIPDVSAPQPHTEAGLVMDKIGIVGLPVMRVVAHQMAW